MAFRDELDFDKLSQGKKDLINMIDRNIAIGLEDIKKGKVHTGEEVLSFLMRKLENKKNIELNLIPNKELVGTIV